MQRGDEARALLDDALAVASAHSNRLLLAEVQRDRGLLLRELGDPDAGRAALLDSADHFARLGAIAESEATRALAG
jgi:hypothetical protein